MSHIIASDKQRATLARGNRAMLEKQRILDYITEEQSNAVYIKDSILNPTDETKQMGTPLNSEYFEKVLATVLPSSVVFIDNPWRPGFRAAVRMLRRNDMNNGAFETIVPYERGILPEHSVLQLIEEELPDPDVISRKKSISRKDLGKYEYRKGEGYVFDEGAKAGFIKNQKLGREVKRGWRTVLIRLIQAGYMSVSTAERLFPATGNDLSWSQHTGKQKLVLPW